jgi:hypothetical protein
VTIRFTDMLERELGWRLLHDLRNDHARGEQPGHPDIHLTVGSEHVVQSSADGVYKDALAADERGPWTIQASSGSAKSPICPIAVYDAPGGGSFVIGDGHAAVGAAVTFWGAQWWEG